MKASKIIKWLLIAVIVIGGGAVGAYYYINNSKKVEYTFARLERGDIEANISSTGTCNAMVTVQVGSQVSGNILELHADFNTKVKKGQLVARIDPAVFQAKVDQTQASLDSARSSVVSARAGLKKSDADIASAEANVVNQRANIVRAQSSVKDAKTKLDRRLDLFKQGVTSMEDRDSAQSTYDQAVASLEAAEAQLKATQATLESVKAQRETVQTQLESAQSQVKVVQATLEQGKLDLEHTEIRAPVDGTVIARNMDVGQTVAASFSAPTIFQIAQDLTKMQVDANIDESDIARVQLAQTASFTVDAYPGQVFQGEVSQIRRAPINVQNVITYDVVVHVENPDLKLFPGMTANIRILTQRLSGVVRIPSAALRFRPPDVVAATKTGTQGGQGGQGGRKGGGGGGGGGFGGGGGARGGGGRGGGGMQTVYTLGEDGTPKPQRIRTGIGDGNFVALVGENLKEGQEVIVGMVSKTPAPAPVAFPGGPGGPGRGRGFGF